jgi:tRNA (adenine37-N6)-methyltransferase
MKLKVIGVIHSPFQHATGTPIQPRAAGGAKGTVQIFDEFAAGLKDLEGFGRIWLIYWFDRAQHRKCNLVVKPYLDDTPRGVFATRAPARPNPIGLSPVRLLDVRGNTLHVSDLDVLDGTPLLDIKPYFPQFDSFMNVKSGWLRVLTLRGAKADNRFEKREVNARRARIATRPSAGGRLASRRRPGSRA